MYFRTGKLYDRLWLTEVYYYNLNKIDFREPVIARHEANLIQIIQIASHPAMTQPLKRAFI